MKRIGLVAIGRNEGDRLRKCLLSAIGKVSHAVYVDSGSVDGSVEFARSLGVEVVELDLSRPFTAARARNAGFERLLQAEPQIEYVQFVDGDCELVEGWLTRAAAELDARPDPSAFPTPPSTTDCATWSGTPPPARSRPAAVTP